MNHIWPLSKRLRESALDGFVAGPNEDFQQLFAWMTSGDTDYTLTIGKKEQKLKIAEESVERLDDAINTTGALVAGRRLYELTNGWGGHHPVGAPVVVVTHRPPTGMGQGGMASDFRNRWR